MTAVEQVVDNAVKRVADVYADGTEVYARWFHEGLVESVVLFGSYETPELAKEVAERVRRILNGSVVISTDAVETRCNHDWHYEPNPQFDIRVCQRCGLAERRDWWNTTVWWTWVRETLRQRKILNENGRIRAWALRYVDCDRMEKDLAEGSGV